MASSNYASHAPTLVVSESSSRTCSPPPTHQAGMGSLGLKSAPQSGSVSRAPSPTLPVKVSGDRRRRWWESVRVGSGILRDIRARAPYYVSDWTDAWNYRVIPAVVLIFFAKCVTNPSSIAMLLTSICLQCITRHRILSRSHRNNAPVRRLRSTLVILYGSVHFLHLWGAAAMYSWRNWPYHCPQQDYLQHHYRTSR